MAAGCRAACPSSSDCALGKCSGERCESSRDTCQGITKKKDEFVFKRQNRRVDERTRAQDNRNEIGARFRQAARCLV